MLAVRGDDAGLDVILGITAFDCSSGSNGSSENAHVIIVVGTPKAACKAKKDKQPQSSPKAAKASESYPQRKNDKTKQEKKDGRCRPRRDFVKNVTAECTMFSQIASEYQIYWGSESRTKIK